MRAAPLEDDRPPLTGWCSACRATQPCAPRRDGVDKDASTPHRCRVCDRIIPNPIIRLRSRRASA